MEWLNNKRDILLAKVNVLSENILKHMYYYAGYNLKYSMKHREKIKQQENKKRYVYYHEYNFFNILLLVYALGLLLVFVLLYAYECDIVSESFLGRIKESFRCDMFISLFMAIVLLSFSYIIGGPVRIVSIIGFCVLGTITLSKRKNIYKLTNATKEFIGLVQTKNSSPV
tara:strand:+ start:741 stop:1250 length:510 start_codon:yes stop_codon:yes gene_type:complete